MNSKKTGFQAGFTIGEMVIVIAIIAILAALITPLAVNTITQGRIDACIKELENIKKAIVGDPELVQNGTRSSFGFVGDIGLLPATLDQLTDGTGLPAYPQTSPSGNTTWGWRGNYISDYRDPWGRDYLYINNWPGGSPTFLALPPIIAVIRSVGPDGQDDGGADDDISIVIRTDEAFSMVSGNMLDECGAGVQYQSVQLNYPVGTTTLGSQLLIPGAGQVVFNFTIPVPIGVREISFLAEVGDTTTQTQFMIINNGPSTTRNLKDPDVCN